MEENNQQQEYDPFVGTGIEKEVFMKKMETFEEGMAQQPPNSLTEEMNRLLETFEVKEIAFIAVQMHNNYRLVFDKLQEAENAIREIARERSNQPPKSGLILP